MDRNAFRRELAQQLRVDSIRTSAAAGSGHPTSSMSAAELMAVLLDGHLRLDPARPDDPARDHLIFSKGHASPLFYSCLKAAGAIADDELLTFRKLGSRLEGHPTPVLPWVDVATGSLGQGLPIGAGIALTARKLDRVPARVWVLCGDGEMAEGSIWEAFDHASFWKLDNLIAIVDVNRLGQTGETMHGWDLDVYAERARAFGWQAIEVDGHDVEAIEDAYARPRPRRGSPRPSWPAPRRGPGSQPSRTCRTATASRSRTPTPRSRSWAAPAISPSRSRRPSGSSRTDSRPQAVSARASSSATRSPPARRTARR